MKKIIFLGLIVSLMVGCSHSLRITNEENFSPSPIKPSKAVKIGFLPTEDYLLNCVIEEINLQSAVEMAKKNYQIGSGVEVDCVSELSRNTKFRASGQNFLITIPGFLIFTHAWLGYKYYVDIDTQSRILDPSEKTLSEATIVTPYEIRHTSFARGAWSSLLGWIVPGYGAAAILPGLVFATTYDKRATPEFIKKVEPSYKAFVGSKILEQIAETQRASSSGLKQFFKMEPVVIGDDIKEDVATNVNDSRFAIYVMRVEGGRLIPLRNMFRELPEETRQVLDNMAKKEIVPDADNVKNVLLSLGIPEIDFPKGMEGVSIYTMQGEKMLALFKGNDTDFQVARR